MTPEEAMRHGAKNGTSLLESFQMALHSIKTGKWDFQNWTLCTCGHIYAAAHQGNFAAFEAAVYRGDAPGTRYHLMLETIVEANALDTTPFFWRDHQQKRTLHMVVSEATVELARTQVRKGANYDPGSRATKRAAITLVEKTIAYIEDIEHKALLAAKA